MRSRKRSSSSETYTTPQQLTHTAPANITLVGGVELGGEGLEPEEKSLDQLKIDALTLEVQALRARCALLEAENKKLAKEKSLAENALRLRGNEPQTQPPQSPTRVEQGPPIQTRSRALSEEVAEEVRKVSMSKVAEAADGRYAS